MTSAHADTGFLNLLASFETGLAAADSASDPGGVVTAGVAPLAGLSARELANTPHVLFWLIDGFAERYLEATPELARDLAGYLNALVPSTTSTVIHSLLACAPPAAHGVLGWTLNDPDRRQTLQPLPARAQTWSHPGRGADHAAEPESFDSAELADWLQPHTPRDRAGLAQRIAAGRLADGSRRRVVFHAPAKIADSAYNRLMSQGATVRAFDDLDELIDHAVEQAASTPAFQYLYWSELDTFGHREGPQGPRVRQHLRQIDAAYHSLRRRLAAIVASGAHADTPLLITGTDHGMLAVDTAIDLGTSPVAAHLYGPISGEPRLPFVRIRHGAQAEFLRAMRDHHPQIRVTPVAEWLEGARFGPAATPHPGLERRLGDFVLEPPPRAYCVDSRNGPVPQFRGAHGGLTREERRIPWFRNHAPPAAFRDA